MVDTPRYEIRPCAPLAPRCKSVLVAWSLESLAQHTQTVNLYALLTLPVGQAHGEHYRQVRSGRRLARPKNRLGLPSEWGDVDDDHQHGALATGMSTRNITDTVWAGELVRLGTPARSQPRRRARARPPSPFKGRT